MNVTGKTLAILTSAFSVAFLGFAFMARIAGPNWAAEADGLEHYQVEKIAGEKGAPTTYNVKNKHTKEAVKQGLKILPEALVAAYDDEANQNIQKRDKIKDVPKNLKDQAAAIAAMQKVDVKAMETREQEMLAEYERLVKQLDALGVEIRGIADETKAVRDEGELRREDVSRMRFHLEELEVDLFQLKEQKKRLQDELSRLQGVLARLRRRNVQLGSAAYEPAAN